jgi:hypothetical protein
MDPDQSTGSRHSYVTGTERAGGRPLLQHRLVLLDVRIEKVRVLRRLRQPEYLAKRCKSWITTKQAHFWIRE